MSLNYDFFAKKTLISLIALKTCSFTFNRDSNDDYHLFALLTGDDELYLYYKNDQNDYLEKVNWFQDGSRKVATFAFDPTGTWLVVITLEPSTFIVPALKIVDNGRKMDSKWDSDDVTELKMNFDTQTGTATRVVWWQTTELNHYAIIGFSNGIILIQSLTDGSNFKHLKVNGEIRELKITPKNQTGAISLLITGINYTQWSYVLEKERDLLDDYVDEVESNNDPVAGTSTDFKTKFRNWKHFSTEKCKNIIQKYFDYKFSKIINSDKRTTIKEEFPELITDGKSISDTQTVNGEDFFLSLSLLNNLLAVYKAVCVYNVINQRTLYQLSSATSGNLKLSKSFIFGTNVDRSMCMVISRRLCETQTEERTEFLDQYVCARFTFEDSIMDMYPVSDNRCYVVTRTSLELIYLKESIHDKALKMIGDDCRHLSKAIIIMDIFNLNVNDLFDDIFDKFVKNNQILDAIMLHNHEKCDTSLFDFLVRLSSKGVHKEAKHYAKESMKSKSLIDLKAEVSDLILMNSLTLFYLYHSRNNLFFSCLELRFLVNFLTTNFYCNVSRVCEYAINFELWPIVAVLLRAKHIGPYINHILGNRPLFDGYKSTTKFFHNFLLEGHFLKTVIFNENSFSLLEFIENNFKQLSDVQLLTVLDALNPSQEFCKPLIMKYLSRFANKTIQINESQVIVYVQKLFFVYLEMLLKYLNDCGLSYQTTLIERSSSNLAIKVIRKDVFIKRCVLSTNINHTILIDASRNVNSFGLSESGCLGNGPHDPIKNTDPAKINFFTKNSDQIDVIAVSCGSHHTLFLTNIGILACGSNRYGQLGLGCVQEAFYPELIEHFQQFQHEVVIEVTSGHYHSLARTNFGNVYSWGWGLYGQLGHDDIEDYHFPTLINYFLQNNLKVSQIAAGHSHSLILTEGGEVYTFGNNFCAQLGNGNDSSRERCPIKVDISDIVLISTTNFDNLALTVDNKLYSWGCHLRTLRFIEKFPNASEADKLSYFTPKLINIGHLDGRIVQISTGAIHSAVVTDKHKAYLWGRNYFGQLGFGHRLPQVEPFLLTINNKALLCKQIVCGANHTLAIDENDNVWGWGNNCWGQLGISAGKSDLLQSFGNNPLIPEDVLSRLNTTVQNSFDAPERLTWATALCETPIHTIDDIELKQKSVIKLYKKNYAQNTLEEVLPPETKSQQSPKQTEITAKTLNNILETFFNFYNIEEVLDLCLNQKNYQAASKIALLNNNFMDSFTYQLEACSTDSTQDVTVDEARKIIESYISTVEDSKNQLLVQNVLRKSIDFWLQKQFDTSILEEIFLNAIETCFCPLTVLLFCKDFPFDSDTFDSADDFLNLHQKSNEFLKNFSTKFCLTLCKMALERKNR